MTAPKREQGQCPRTGGQTNSRVSVRGLSLGTSNPEPSRKRYARWSTLDARRRSCGSVRVQFAQTSRQRRKAGASWPRRGEVRAQEPREALQRRDCLRLHHGALSNHEPLLKRCQRCRREGASREPGRDCRQEPLKPWLRRRARGTGQGWGGPG